MCLSWPELSRKAKVAGKLLPIKPPYLVNLIVERYNYVHLFMNSLKTIPELNSKKDPIAEDAASLVAELGEISLGLSWKLPPNWIDFIVQEISIQAIEIELSPTIQLDCGLCVLYNRNGGQDVHTDAVMAWTMCNV